MLIEDCKSKTPREALERFEVSVRAQEMYISEIQHCGESSIDSDEVNKNYDETKAELLVWFSYLPRGLTR